MVRKRNHMLNILVFLVGLALLIPALYLMHLLRLVLFGIIFVVGYLIWWTFDTGSRRHNHYRGHDEN